MLKRLLKGATSLSYHPEGRFNYEDGEIDRAEYAIRDHFDERTISGLSQNEQLGTVQVSEPLAAAAACLMVTKPQFVNATEHEPGDLAILGILQENHYYPFGMNMEGPWTRPILLDGQGEEVTDAEQLNDYLYNGKKLNTDLDLNWNDYGARWYDPAIGRWNAVDPLAAKYASISPYAYVANNPLIYIDPDGRKIRGVNVKDGQITYSKRAIKNGTKRYIEARMKTKSGTAGIMSMIGAKKRYSVMATDKVFVLPTGNGKYALAAGVTDSESGTLVVTTTTARPGNVTDEQLNDAVTLGATGELVGVKVGQGDLESPISDPNGEYQQGYSAAYNDSGMAEFESDPNNAYQSAEE